MPRIRNRHTLFEWLARRRHQQELIEPEGVQGVEGQEEVPRVRRVKSPAEDAEPLAHPSGQWLATVLLSAVGALQAFKTSASAGNPARNAAQSSSASSL